MVGILALQGDFAAHRKALADRGVSTREVRKPADLQGLSGLVLPGGESTTMLKLLAEFALEAPLKQAIAGGLPVLATCAGVILLAREVQNPPQPSLGLLDVAVVRLPHISNATDFEPLSREEGVALRYVSSSARLGSPDAVILPGSKSTASDLAWLRESGLAARVTRLAESGVPVLGICGGYQMLGERLEDPEGVESEPGEVTGLGLLPLVTVLAGEKSTHRVRARALKEIPVLGLDRESPPITGYEIHMGRSSFAGDPPLLIVERDGAEALVEEGAMHDSLPVFGCYLHGLFENPCVRKGFIRALWERRGVIPRMAASGEAPEWWMVREERLGRLARVVRASLRMEEIYRLLGMGGG